MPFTTTGALEALGGTASVNSGNIKHITKGIYSSGQDFIYNSGVVKLDINGFANATNTGLESIGIFSNDSVVELKQIELNFIDNPSVEHNLSVFGIKVYASGVVKVGDDSKVTVSGNVSNQNGTYTMKGLYASNSNVMEPGVIEAGNDFELNVTNNGKASTYGIDAYNGAKVSVGRDMKLFVAGQGEIRGIRVGGGATVASVNIGENAYITAKSQAGAATGIFSFGGGDFKAESGLVVDVSTGSSSETAYGVWAINSGSKIELNGASVLSEKGTDRAYAFFTHDQASIIGNTGKYNIIGNSYAGSGALIDITANDISIINGWIRKSSDAEINLSLSDHSLWIMKGNSNLTSLVNDNSVVDMTNDGNTFSTLTVEHLSGNNGVIKMDIDASKNAVNSDKLYITDSLIGTQYIDLYEVNGYTPVGVEGVGTVLATVNNNNGTLVAKDGEGTLYWKRYELDHQDTADLSGDYTRDWYLKQVLDIEGPTTSTDTILSANALNYHTWRTENDKLMQRMGELHHNGEAQQGTWFRVKGTKIGRDGKFDFENKYTTYELGYDRLTKQTEKMKRYQGVALSYTAGTSSYNCGTGDNSSKSINFYTTQMGSKGHYLDVVFKVSNMENDFSVYDTNSNKITGDANNTGVSLSAEYGRKNDLKLGWYIEPQAQFTLGYLSGDNYFTSNGIEVSQSGIKSAVGRIGFNIGKEVGSRGIVYAKANLLHEFGGSYDVTMHEGADRLKVSDTFNDTWFEYGIGAAFSTSKNSHLYMAVERSAGSDFKKDWQWNVGARWNF